MSRCIKIAPEDFWQYISEDTKVFLESPAPFMPVIEEAYAIGPRKWFAIQTNPKCEERAADRINRAGFISYLPKGKIWGKRDKMTNKMPRRVVNIMPGYLLVHLPAEGAFDTIRRCDGVFGFVTSQGAPSWILDKWIEDIQDRERKGEFDKTRRRKGVRNDKSPFPEWVYPGALVRIADGPFASFIGHIIEAPQINRVKVEVHVFARSTPLDLELAQIERIC